MDEVKPYPTDSQVSTITLRHGNIDYVTNMVARDPVIHNHGLPNSAIPIVAATLSHGWTR